ncbi:hypothetical protein KZ829_14580 [Actinoplanes hulinensis]|uniref:NYN domain-containing protein n=1 Tax=Actinoplanes hulinensis TaxID=1144547 RepID=A0ABS7B1Q2_9ACTN|nr:hypothetical protein [Actinoplanes hulinensis]MBW6434965.1 hypothetical protein [Actinoplanes hulinensis]
MPADNVTHSDATDLCRIYGLPDETREQLMELACGRSGRTHSGCTDHQPCGSSSTRLSYEQLQHVSEVVSAGGCDSVRRRGAPRAQERPDGVHPGAIQAIREEGAAVTVVSGDYDTAVRAARTEHGLLVQDTAWPGHERVPAGSSTAALHQLRPGGSVSLLATEGSAANPGSG